MSPNKSALLKRNLLRSTSVKCNLLRKVSPRSGEESTMLKSVVFFALFTISSAYRPTPPCSGLETLNMRVIKLPRPY